MNDTVLTLEEDAVTFDALLRSIYKSPAIACVRELIRNAIDSHLDSGVARKVDIQFTDQFFYLRDYGDGITPEQLTNLVSVIMRSGKRNNDSKGTGGYGLGSKTVFGILYDDLRANRTPSEMFMISIADGVKSTYQLLLDDGKPKYRLIDRNVSDEDSGVAYYIELCDAIKNMDSDTFLTIFSPVLKDLNFIGGKDFNDYIETFNVGNFNINVLKCKDDDRLPFKVTMATGKPDKPLIFDKLSSDSKVFIQYKDMLYPIPSTYSHYANFDCLLECVERKLRNDASGYHYAVDEYLICHNIERESYGMEPTRSRDSLITEGMTNEQTEAYREYLKESLVAVGHNHFVNALVISTLNRFSTFLDNNDLPRNYLLDEGYYETVNHVEDIATVVSHYILCDTFINDISSRLVRNTANRNYDLNPLDSTFSVDDVINVFSSSAIYTGMIMLRGLYRDDLSASFYNCFEKIFKKFELTTVLNNPGTNMDYSIDYGRIVFHQEAPNALVLRMPGSVSTHGKLSIADFTHVTETRKVFSFYENEDDVMFLYKDRKVDSRKMEKLKEDNHGKYIVLFDRDQNHDFPNKDNSRMVSKDSIIRRALNMPGLKMVLLNYHSRKPIVMLSDALADIKVKPKAKVKRGKHELKVNDLTINARGVEICHPVSGYNVNPTYNDILSLINDSDKVICFKYSESTVSKSYYGDMFTIMYDYSCGGDFKIRFKHINTPHYTTINTHNVGLKQGVIYFTKKPSNAIVEYLSNNNKVDDGEAYLNLLVDEFEYNDFKSINGWELDTFGVNPMDMVDLKTQTIIEHTRSVLSYKLNDIEIASTTAYLSRRTECMNTLALRLLNRHIFDSDKVERVKEINTSALNCMLLTYSKDEVELFIDECRSYCDKCDSLLNSYSKYEWVFINSLLCIISMNYINSNDPETNLDEMEQLHRL